MVLVMHSYGGVAGNGSAVGLSKKERAREKNKKGGVVGLVFISAYVAREGQTVRKNFASRDPKLVEKSLALLDIDVSLSFFGKEGTGLVMD